MDREKSLIDKVKMKDKNSRKKGIEDGMTNPKHDMSRMQTWHQGDEGSLQTGEQWAEKL